MPLPYLGSKRKSAGKIYQTIKNFNPEAEIICDLFCGGFAISEYFIQNGWEAISNDKNKYVIAILKQTILEGLDEAKCLEFVTREKFTDVMQNKDKYEDWYVGYVMCVWSFGNNQSKYLFGKDTEPAKRAGHELVVNKNPDPIKKLIPNIPQKYIDGILKQKDWHTRRIALLRVNKALQTRIFELEQLQQLERIEQLEQLERPKLQFFCGDYFDVKIPDGAVIYCDPPYKGTAEYHEGAFNHNQFWDWVREKSKTNKVYISEYQAPSDFKKILEFSQVSTLARVQNKGQPNECLFTIK
jgi:site-specific DNA-adenine methylase